MATATTAPTPFLFEAPTISPSESIAPIGPLEQGVEKARSISLWVNETSAEHEAVLDEIISDFSTSTGIDIELSMVVNRTLPELVRTADQSNTLPDLILHPAEFSIGWARKGIFDASAATEVVESLGRDTFESHSLQQLKLDEGGSIAAVPSDLWRSMVIYRTDWFEEQGLAPPDDYQSLFSAAERFYLPEENSYGLVVPTDAADDSTQRLFEFIALANGCHLIDQAGEVTFLHPACLEALEYYRSLINQFSPIGVQTEISTLNAYLAGRTGLVFATSADLPAIAGLDKDFQPTCSECLDRSFLPANSGFIFDLRGSGEFAEVTSISSATAMGITEGANISLVSEFIHYWFNDGYAKWLAINPERKIPLRHNQEGQSQIFIDTWKKLPVKPGEGTLEELFGRQLVDDLVNGGGNDGRWGLESARGEVLSLIYEEHTLSPLLQEMLSGYFSSSQTVIEIYKAIVAAIPDYGFPVEALPETTATP